MFLHGPAGQIRPRTLAEGYRGTEPSTPSSPERSGVSDDKKTECLWTYCIEELIDALGHILNIESWWFIKHTSYFSSAQSIQCSLLGYCLPRRLKRFLIANYRRLKKNNHAIRLFHTTCSQISYTTSQRFKRFFMFFKEFNPAFIWSNVQKKQYNCKIYLLFKNITRTHARTHAHTHTNTDSKLLNIV